MPLPAKTAIKYYAAKRPRGARWPKLVFYTDDHVALDPARLAPHLPAGSIILIRGRTMADKNQQWQRWHTWARRYRLQLYMSWPWHGVRLHINGWHKPHQQPLTGRPHDAKPWLCSAHNRAEIQQVQRLPMLRKAVILSPLYQTASHVGSPPLGMLRFRCCCQSIKNTMAYGLGGVTISRLAHVPAPGSALLRGTVAIM